MSEQVPHWFPLHPAIWPLASPETWETILNPPCQNTSCCWVVEGTVVWGWVTQSERLPKEWPALQERLPARWIEVHLLAPEAVEVTIDTPRVRSTSQEILCWERSPERGVLHDPPLRWREVSAREYLTLWETWQPLERPGFRRLPCLQRWSQRLPLRGYVIAPPEGEPHIALLAWHAHPTLVYVVDCVWRPGTAVRRLGRYLFQELYLHHREAHVVLEFEPVDSPLNPVLMALGYRVHRRWWEHVWVTSASAGTTEQE